MKLWRPTRSRRLRIQGDHGFTIVELVVVILLLGVLSAVAFPRFVGPDAFAPSVVTHQLRSELRLAHALAANRQNAAVYFELSQTADQWVIRTISVADGELRATGVAKDGTSITASSGAASATLGLPQTLRADFDGMGSLTAVTIAGVAGDAAAGLSLQVVGETSRSLCVYSSGYTDDAPCA